MAVEKKVDEATSINDIDLSKGDIPLNFKSSELKEFEIAPRKAPFHPRLKGQDFNKKPKYADAEYTKNG